MAMEQVSYSQRDVSKMDRKGRIPPSLPLLPLLLWEYGCNGRRLGGPFGSCEGIPGLRMGER